MHRGAYCSCACWSMDWHWLARCGMPVRGRVWRVVASYGGASTFAAMPCHWLPRLNMRGDSKLRPLLAIAHGDYIHLPCVAIHWLTLTCGDMHYHGRQQ
jgi:hypothetical protein